MKGIVSVLVKPIAARLGALAAGAVSGFVITDVDLATRVESWVFAGVLLAADLVGSYFRSKSQEVR
ncbi:hypothetical protein [Rhizobium rhizogenes]|uniref:hypothetical protein n=1 Tax=Rhizobium rhizogenes TaxID=359 RepID=UPI0022C4FAA3|nr:hypothetical protein [Rhizobium rhizogenes]MCZ7455268.1 hypothetical protein [Rhizobium rhizogenes]